MAKEPLEINLAGIKIIKNSASPLYSQVYDQFREMILTRRLRPDDRLPATRNLAKVIGVSRTIITQSFEQLILEGYLIGKPGSGTYVAKILPDSLLNTKPVTKSDGILILEREIEPIHGIPNNILLNSCCKEEILPFQRGTPSFDLFPYKVWHKSANTVFKKLKNYHLGYENTLGFLPLRQQIASYLRMSRAVKCEADQVVIVTGSQQGLNLIIKCLLKSGDKVWMEDPGFQSARMALLNSGMELCPIPVEMDGLNINYGKLNYPDAKLAYITPSHQYPLGVMLSLQKRLEILQWAAQKKMWIFEDDYDSEFRYEGKPLASLQGLDTGGNVIYTGTFSKVLFPGLRLAYLVLPSLLMVEQMKKIKAILDRQSPIIDQLILTKFFEEGHFLRHIRKMRLLYEERQQILINLMNEHLAKYVEINPLPAGMNLTGWLSPDINIEKFREENIKKGLIVPILEDYSEKHLSRQGISLGYTAFSKYKLKTAVEKLVISVQNSIV